MPVRLTLGGHSLSPQNTSSHAITTRHSAISTFAHGILSNTRHTNSHTTSAAKQKPLNTNLITPPFYPLFLPTPEKTAKKMQKSQKHA